MDDRKYMLMAIRLARRALSSPSSRPATACVIVASGRLVGEAFGAGTAADSPIISALEQAGSSAEGGTVYAPVEPSGGSDDLDHCVFRLASHRVARVVVGALTGESFRTDSSQRSTSDSLFVGRLREAGVVVDIGIMADECRKLNEIYFKYSSTGMPFVTVKLAQSLDGRIATVTGDSQWISSPASLRLAHQLRRAHQAVMVGIGTVLVDDPRLTVRLVDGGDPLRIVVDSRLRLPLKARVLAGGAAHRTLVATSLDAPPDRIDKLESLGVDVVRIASAASPAGVDLPALLAELGRRSLASVLVEGGANIVTSLLSAECVDRLVMVIAPKIIGSGINAIGNLGIARLSDAITLTSAQIRRAGPDLVIDGRLGK